MSKDTPNVLKRVLFTTSFLLAGLSIAAIALWWRDGMWLNGELPTHGMIATVGFAITAIMVLQARMALAPERGPKRGIWRALLWLFAAAVVLAGAVAVFLFVRP